MITGDAEFFVITKRLHNQIHGEAAGGPLSEATPAITRGCSPRTLWSCSTRYGRAIWCCCTTRRLLGWPRRWRVRVRGWRGAAISVWTGKTTPPGRGGAFCGRTWPAAEGYVFSRREYVPPWVPSEKVAIIPPSIDPFSPKNQHLDDDTVRAILARIGVLDGAAPNGRTSFLRGDGGMGAVTRSAGITGEAAPALMIRWWFRFPDGTGSRTCPGSCAGFADYVAPSGSGYLLLAGPAVAGVTDDPEGAAVFGDCLLQWRDLPAAARARVLLVTLPLDDVDENAAMVNALQRHATVITQKSLAEGFGLTVAEGMWKGRPVVGSAVGGIIDQIADGTGILLPDPRDLEAFGTAVRRLLDHPDEASQMGHAAQAHIREHYVGDLHLLRYERLFSALISEG